MCTIVRHTGDEFNVVLNEIKMLLYTIKMKMDIEEYMDYPNKRTTVLLESTLILIIREVVFQFKIIIFNMRTDTQIPPKKTPLVTGEDNMHGAQTIRRGNQDIKQATNMLILNHMYISSLYRPVVSICKYIYILCMQ